MSSWKLLVCNILMSWALRQHTYPDHSLTRIFVALRPLRHSHADCRNPPLLALLCGHLGRTRTQVVVILQGPGEAPIRSRIWSSGTAATATIDCRCGVHVRNWSIRGDHTCNPDGGIVFFPSHRCLSNVVLLISPTPGHKSTDWSTTSKPRRGAAQRELGTTTVLRKRWRLSSLARLFSLRYASSTLLRLANRSTVAGDKQKQRPQIRGFDDLRSRDPTEQPQHEACQGSTTFTAMACPTSSSTCFGRRMS